MEGSRLAFVYCLKIGDPCEVFGVIEVIDQELV